MKCRYGRSGYLPKTRAHNREQINSLAGKRQFAEAREQKS
jgi:hypothetical protein